MKIVKLTKKQGTDINTFMKVVSKEPTISGVCYEIDSKTNILNIYCIVDANRGYFSLLRNDKDGLNIWLSSLDIENISSEVKNCILNSTIGYDRFGCISIIKNKLIAEKKYDRDALFSKRYELNNGLTEEELKKAGFRRGGWMMEVKEPKLQYTTSLIDNIELNIEMSITDGKVLNFDDYNNVYVMDENYGQPYAPFYDSNSKVPYLKRVISRYNEEMDKLVKKGILKEKTLEDAKGKVKTLKRNSN